MPLAVTATNIFIVCALFTMWAMKNERAAQARLIATALLALAIII